MVDWNKVRRDFPIAKHFIYLDHASCAPMPEPVFRETLRYYRELGGLADFSWHRWVKRREEVRRKVARWIGAEPEEIAFTNSTSHGMTLVAELIAGEGDILTNVLEFPATTVPWVYRKAKLKFLEPEQGIISVNLIQRHLNSRIRTILTSFVQYQNGFRQDLEALGRIKGNRFFVVNATQGFGYLPIHVREARIDFLATNSYKWLMAGYGGGILYVNQKWVRRFKPSSCGWRSVPHPELFDNRHARLKEDASRYEFGCPPFPHIFAIGRAVDYLSDIGLAHVWERIRSLTDFLIDELRKCALPILSPLEPSARSGIVVFSVGPVRKKFSNGVKNAQKLTNQLLARRIYVSARGGGIRVAPHMYNTEQDIARFIKALREEIRRL